MAGNFWQSSHCAQWVLDKVDLSRERAADLIALTEDEYNKIMIFYSSFIQVCASDVKLCLHFLYSLRFLVNSSS